MALTTVLDAALDRAVAPGYTRLGSSLRRRWWPADPEPGCLVGRRVLVTGATSGIGEAMAASFAELGATVHLHGRNPAKVAASARALRLSHPGAEVVEEICDISDLDAVRTWGAELAERLPALHGVVHNAGTMTRERTESAQGHEMSLAAHVLGPHLLTHLLAPTLAVEPASVVWMSSGGMYGAGLRTADADEIEYRTGSFNGVQAYARTKRMQVVLAEAWAHRLAPDATLVTSMHPGWVRTPGVSEHLPAFDRITRPTLRTPTDGADTAVWLVATRPESHAPHFWHDRAQRPTTAGWQRDEDPARVASLVSYVAEATGTPPLA
ncbi:MAG: SDR family NAD(P)-dependent oxidoreductase [Actinobacteria bacterium]|nr:SDR family NAD(P)-dependent oxidoreductase [Actinomycetota bacterium]